jgi:hypothetical protein
VSTQVVLIGNELVAELRSMGSQAELILADVRKEADVSALILVSKSPAERNY